MALSPEVVVARQRNGDDDHDGSDDDVMAFHDVSRSRNYAENAQREIDRAEDHHDLEHEIV
jgi:hypothetical protein